MSKHQQGLGIPGANIADISLIRETVGHDMGVKASGGIRNINTVLDMIDAGASELGLPLVLQ